VLTNVTALFQRAVRRPLGMEAVVGEDPINPLRYYTVTAPLYVSICGGFIYILETREP